MGKKIIVATRSDLEKKYCGGAGFHLKNMLTVLKSRGHEVIVTQCKTGAYDAPLTAKESQEFTEFVNAVKPDVVMADYSWMCDALTGDVLKICFVHDLRCRIIPCLEKIGYKDNQGWTEEKEAKLLTKADILLVLNEEDAAFCMRMAPNSKIVRIGIAMEPVPHNSAQEIPGRCIYVGSENMENRAALRWFLENVWPDVRNQVPGVYLNICMGPTPDLDKHYAQAQLAVVPHIMNGGLKIRVAEAFAHGLPVVGNKCAFYGFENGGGGIANDDPVEMASEIIYLFNDNRHREEKSIIAKRVAKEYMTPKAAYGLLLDILA